MIESESVYRQVANDAAARGWELKVYLPGQGAPRAFSSLPCQNGFKALDWVGFVANGARKTVFYVDAIVIEAL